MKAPASAADGAPPAAARGAGPATPAWQLHVAESGPSGDPAEPRLPLAFAPFLFLEPAHLALARPAGPVLSFYLEEPGAGLTVALLHVELNCGEPGRASSPGQAPFGGVQATAGLPAAALHQLLDGVEAVLRRRGQRRLHLRGHAFCYDPANAARLAEVLRQRRYPVVLAEQNYHLDLRRDFLTHLTYNERHCVRRCQRAGLVVEQEPPLLLPLAYEFMLQCRQERGHGPALPLARVQALFAAFPRQHLLLSVRTPTGEWAAIGVAIQVSPQVLYEFYVASPLRFNQLSPAVLLHGGLHAFAQASGLRVLDLGTSTLPTGPNASLLRFKRHLGGVAGLRLSWEKPLAGG
ncbi:GNAT family N-acetyltransferase [uncultured Hymenobacter sp.]|uniref:GNAT family N-acetyltransferase n=1 Tax=uncultured Hymenobacter sp. TaxID=170016 RepID=UPI0035CB0AA1